MSSPVPRRRGPAWLHPGWSWTVGRAWVITALSASVTLILGAVLGALPALLGGSWHDAQTRDQTWVLLVFAAVSLAAAVIAVALSRKRRWVLRQNGTAYVIQEFAAAWDSQDERAFLEAYPKFSLKKYSPTAAR
jgi:VIT1/CCC1 family predicted Fe2+/Mn2+ transporter